MSSPTHPLNGFTETRWILTEGSRIPKPTHWVAVAIPHLSDQQERAEGLTSGSNRHAVMYSLLKGMALTVHEHRNDERGRTCEEASTAAAWQEPHSWKRLMVSTALLLAPGWSRLMPSKVRSCRSMRCGGFGCRCLHVPSHTSQPCPPATDLP